MSALLHRLRVILNCLCVLLVIGFILWRLNLNHDINLELAAIRAAGLPTNGQEANDYYPAVPDNQNAAVAMRDVFRLMTNYPDGRSNDMDGIYLPGRKGALASEQMKLISGYCAMNSNALEQAQEAVKMPRCRYPIDLSLGAEIMLPHLRELKILARAAGFQSVLDPSESEADISMILGISRTLDNEPVLVSKLVRIAMIDTAVGVLERRLNGSAIDSKESNVSAILFGNFDQTNQMANGLIGERATHITFIRNFPMSGANINKVEGSNGETSDSRASPRSLRLQTLIMKCTGFFERDLRFYLQSMQTNIYLAETYPKNISVITNCEAQIEQAGRHNFYLLSSILMPAFVSPIFKEADGVAKIRTAEVALAVEGYRRQNGRLPENLNELAPQFLPSVPEDPYDGQPLRYHKLAKGYVVYSVGRDGHDNNGREGPDHIKSTDETEYDVTFTVER
jgi:hypothetical protein